MATLVSPGVSVTVIDESNYAPTGPGTVPFILLATQSNKANPAGGMANYTTSTYASTLQLVSSQKELLSNYGLPIFPTDASGNRLFGSEIAEYGLMAAHSVLGITNQCYVLRADVDLAQLIGSSSRPYSNPEGGHQWLNTTVTKWGIFSFAQDYSSAGSNPTFTNQIPLVITDSTLLDGNGVPNSTVGTVGQFAVNALDGRVSDPTSRVQRNPVYQKAYNNTWYLVGSTDWQAHIPAFKGNSQSVSVTQNDSFTINTIPITISATGSASNVVTQINSANIPGVTAAFVNGYVYMFATSAAKSNGSVADGKISITNGVGTPLTAMFGTYTAGSNPSGGWTGPAAYPAGYYGAQFTYGSHYNVPLWKSTDGGTVAPTGSVWIKTTAVNNGANIAVYRYNSAIAQWVSIPAPLYASSADAIYDLDPTQGGLNIAMDSLYTKYNAEANNSAAFQVFQRMGTGALVITGSTANPTFQNTDVVDVQVTIPGQAALSTTYSVTVGTTATTFVNAMLTANIPNLQAVLTTAGHIQLSHTQGGNIYLSNHTGTPLTSAGISSNLPYVHASGSTLIASWWEYASNMDEQATAPIVAPADMTKWYYSTPLEVDLMINDGTIWRGYQELASDSRGYNLQNTDSNGVLISASAPTTQSDGTALVYGDIWLDTSDLENYPKLSRWQRKSGTDQWVPVDNTDSTTENGILFADARWSNTGDVDPALDTKPAIADLLTDHVKFNSVSTPYGTDLDGPNPQLFPRGILLFNTRRSSYNVKEYAAAAFTSTTYPLSVLPSMAATWKSISGKNSNGVPYMGRKAVRNVVVSALREAVDLSVNAREDQRNFNLLVCPGYPELTENLVTLNNDRRNTGFILSDTPMGLSSDLTSVSNYITNAAAVTSDDEEGLATTDSYVATFYPGAAYTNALDGVGQVVVPITHAILRTVVRSDQNSHPWFAPAGTIRGKVDNVTKIGYVDRASGKFVAIGTNQGLRDLLYQNNVNPVAVFPQEGILNYGNHTRQAASTALDRINVARLINYLRYNLERLVKPLVFEPNDTITRNEAKQAVEGLLNDIVAQRGIYDYLVVCDTTNNTPSTIDRNELHIDIAVEPTKAVEFIYVPVRILNTGAIAGTNANQGGLSNITPSVALGV
jgi:Phage tail sheath C-terminal domain